LDFGVVGPLERFLEAREASEHAYHKTGCAAARRGAASVSQAYYRITNGIAFSWYGALAQLTDAQRIITRIAETEEMQIIAKATIC
jgi:hypothetical protein